MTVGRTVAEALEAHRIVPAAEVSGRVRELLARVGLEAAFSDRYPHELSGGQRQRVAIARALAPQPDLIVADEPLSALDVSVQAQILAVFDELKREREVAMLFVSHDLAVVERVADRVLVLYRGRVVEEGPSEELVRDPRHPYTKALLAAVPGADPGLARERVRLRPEPPGRPGEGGCPLAPRCPFVDDVCREIAPGLEPVRPFHRASCHFASDTKT
jgi:oligopeptide/dipeptide ABC transporter ATP-binding protein